MSTSHRRTSTRAEARRRARLAAAGQDPDDEVAEESRSETTARPRGTGILGRLFPPAGPLPGKPDPLADFTYAGPLRGWVSTLYLLARRPIAWVPFGLLWSVSYIVSLFSGNSPLGIVTSLGTFASLVAAGWIGWPRPWAFGAAAAVVGYLGYAAFLAWLAAQGVNVSPGRQVTAADAAISLFFSGIFMVAIGALAGFYGGYLRRRLAEPRPGSERTRRR